MAKYMIETDKEDVENAFIFVGPGLGQLKSVKVTKMEEPEDESPHERWRAEKNNAYYYISCDLFVMRDLDVRSFLNNRLFTFGNYFKTKEDARLAAWRLIVYNELKYFAIPDDKQTMDTDIPYYYIQYDKVMKECEVVNTCLCKCHELYFRSESDARKAIDSVGEDRVKKYYLGIVEE